MIRARFVSEAPGWTNKIDRMLRSCYEASTLRVVLAFYCEYRLALSGKVILKLLIVSLLEKKISSKLFARFY